MDQEQFWSHVKDSIKEKNKHNVPLLKWFEPTELISLEQADSNYVFNLGVPSELHKGWISNNLLESISSEVSLLFKKQFKLELTVTGTKEAPGLNNNSLQEEFDLNFDEDVKQAQSTQASKFNKLLNKDYIFSTFVVGRNNEFAHAAAYNVADNVGVDNYNPLFICGPTGMGKTHLLMAAGNHITEQYPHLRVNYVSAERFLNECVSHIRRNKMDEFRTKYRKQSDVLLMDDIQILGRGERVQEEFFHTLNEFFEKKQQVVVASDRMPKDIKGLEDRIRTRLEWGLIADIQMPDIETRMAILKYKAERKKLRVSHDVVNYVARISKRSIRELEGNLNKVQMFSELQGLNINLELAKKVLSTHDDTTHLAVEDILRLCSDHYEVRIVDLKSKSRMRPIVVARQMSMYLIKKYLDKSLVEIGRAFGGRDHTTVINALRKIENQLVINSDLKRDFNELEGRIHNITGV